MKPFSAYLKKRPAERRTRIEESARQKISAVRLQQAREALGITQGELAERMHMTASTVTFRASAQYHDGDFTTLCRSTGRNVGGQRCLTQARTKRPRQAANDEQTTDCLN
jgi:DNA-binding XRE family transcriptional regulator